MIIKVVDINMVSCRWCFKLFVVVLISFYQFVEAFVCVSIRYEAAEIHSFKFDVENILVV